MTPQQVYNKCMNEKRRILELESIIATSPAYSYNYALGVINGPFEEGEKAIIKDSFYSYRYARDVINGPFEKCHSFIFYSEYKDDYINFLKKKKFDMSLIIEWLI